VARTSLSRDGIEVHRFSWLASIGVPFIAIFLQASIPLRFPGFALFDLPLLVTIFFAVARRNQIAGTVTGCLIGLFQDSLAHHPLGLFGIAKTFIGYAASSIGVRIDVENPGSRLIMTFGFYLLHRGIYQLIATNMARMTVSWHWGHELGAAFANAVLAVLLFAALDRLKQRAR
jgi:rod shape-determining protein MreD